MTLIQGKRNAAPTVLLDWSNRFLALSVAGILFLTLYPFDFSRAAKRYGYSPLLLGHGSKGMTGILLNVLLFVPFGFALAQKALRTRRWKSALMHTATTGAFFSYLIELAQLYLPQRNSSWEDVLTNMIGTAVGFVVFLLVGLLVFQMLSRVEEFLQSRTTPRALGLVLIVYFAAWCFVSTFLDRQVRFSNWAPGCFLVVGSQPTNPHPWMGKLSKLEIWSKALPQREMERVTQSTAAEPARRPLVSLDFLDNPAGEGNARLFVPFGMNSREGEDESRSQDAFEGGSNRPVRKVVSSLTNADQFSIRLVFTAAEQKRGLGRIAALWPKRGEADLYVAQINQSVVLTFHNAVFRRHSIFGFWTPNMFAPGKSYGIGFTFNGARMRCFIDGREIQNYALGPGAVLASYIQRMKQQRLEAYSYIYFMIVFFPPGVLLGMVLTKNFARRLGAVGTVAAGGLTMISAPAVLEWIIRSVGDSPFSISNFSLSVAAVVLGFCWSNLDGTYAVKSARMGAQANPTIGARGD